MKIKCGTVGIEEKTNENEILLIVILEADDEDQSTLSEISSILSSHSTFNLIPDSRPTG